MNADMGHEISVPRPRQNRIPDEAPEHYKAFYRIAGCNPENWEPLQCLGDPFGVHRSDKRRNGMSLERYQRENEKVKSMTALDYAKMFTSFRHDPPPLEPRTSDGTDQDDPTIPRLLSRPPQIATLPSNPNDPYDPHDYYGAFSPSPQQPTPSAPHDPDDLNDAYHSLSQLLAQLIQTHGSSNFNTETSGRSVIGQPYNIYGALSSPEFDPWIPAGRYLSPELDGPWIPYQNAQPTGSSYGSVQPAQSVQPVNRHEGIESGETDSTLAGWGLWTDSDYGSECLSPIRPPKRKKDESDDEFEDPSTKKSPSKSQNKPSSSKVVPSQSKTSSTSSKRKSSAPKSQKQARDGGNHENEGHEVAPNQVRAPVKKSRKRTRDDDEAEEDAEPKAKKAKLQYDPQWNVPNGDLGSWPRDTYEALLKIVCNIRADEAAAGKTGVQGLRDIKLWNFVSAELKKAGHIRSGSACKLFWGRYGRRESQFDERANPDPSRLCTSMQ